MRAKVSLIDFLRRSIRQHSNRLRAVLLRYYPVVLTIFTKLEAPVTLAFLQTYPNPLEAADLNYNEFKTFLRQNHHSHPNKWAACYARLTMPGLMANPEIIQIYQPEALLLAKLLSSCLQAKKQALKDLQSLFQRHPDRAIYQSLPGAGEFLQPALLAKFGDNRLRFPSQAVVQAVAGTSPITRTSGKRRSVHFRRACDREFRFIAQSWAKASVRVSPWAASYYSQIRPHCCSSNDAYRRLANRWLAILWKLWQSHSSYDEAYHLQQRALRALPRP
jgi:tetratricopeptide (TPR) repeat protein